jgi:hypothetical protein
MRFITVIIVAATTSNITEAFPNHITQKHSTQEQDESSHNAANFECK